MKGITSTMKITLCLVVLTMFGFGTVSAKGSDVTEDEIMNAFDENSFMEYNRHALPPSDGPLLVKYAPSMELIENLDVEKQILSVRMYLAYSWQDVRIPKFFEAMGVNRSTPLYMSTSQIWIPDVRLYNSADIRQNDFDDIQVIVTPDGTVYFIPDTTTHTYCPVEWDIEVGDKVNCTLKFGSWTHGANQLTLSLDSTIAYGKYYTFNREWELTAKYVESRTKTYECCPDPIVTEHYTLELQRTSFIKH